MSSSTKDDLQRNDGAQPTTEDDVPTRRKTEKQKMMDGELYQAFGKELLSERIKAKEICFRLNQTSPSDVSTRKSLVKLLLGRDDALVESPFNVDYGYNIRVGKNFYANHGVTILDCNLIKIGDNCLIAPHVCISASTHPLDAKTRSSGDEFAAPISIGNDVWIGANATICPGVSIGDRVVVGAGAVVVCSFGSDVVIGGVPAKVIKNL